MEKKINTPEHTLEGIEVVKPTVEVSPALTLPTVAKPTQAEIIPALQSIMHFVTSAKRGCPTHRTEAIVEEMLARMSCGESLMLVCQDPSMPSYRLVMEWQRVDPELKARFNQVREEGTYAIDDVAELIARKVPGFATGDFRYDDLFIKVLERRKQSANRARFGEKTTLEVTTPLPVIIDASIIEGDGGDGV